MSVFHFQCNNTKKHRSCDIPDARNIQGKFLRGKQNEESAENDNSGLIKHLFAGRSSEQLDKYAA